MHGRAEMVGPITAVGKVSVSVEPEETSGKFEGGIEHF
jgi:hypothetical protein